MQEIKDALRAAVAAMQSAVDQNGCVPPNPEDRAAAAVAAFLRAPDVWRALAEDGTEAVAAALEKAARDE